MWHSSRLCEESKDEQNTDSGPQWSQSIDYLPRAQQPYEEYGGSERPRHFLKVIQLPKGRTEMQTLTILTAKPTL